MLDQLSERLQGVFNPFGNKQMTEEDIDNAIREVRRAFLEADVNLRVIKSFIGRLKERALGADVLKGLNSAQQFVGIVHEELTALLGKETVPLTLQGHPPLVLLFGLQGSGKTTTAGKLALKLKKEGKNPILIAADIYRPAAIDQLIQLGKQIQVPVHHIPSDHPEARNMLAIANTGIQKAKEDGHDVVILDTAGRLQVDTEMMAELLILDRALQPQEKLLVIDAMMGQEAVAVAEAFHTQIAMTGIIITKLDGDARGGAVLSVVETTGQPIKFIGTSEKLTGLDVFHPERMSTRILGMGDVLTLVERAQTAMDLEEAKKLEQKVRKQTFSLNDFMAIQKQLKMLGSFDQILGMLPIPGLSKDLKETLAHTSESSLKRIEVMIQSMTPSERETPELIKEGRLRRIAKGSGVPEGEITQFLKSFEQMRFIMKQMTRMTDDMQKEEAKQAPGALGGMHMPRNAKKKKKAPQLPFGPMAGMGGPGGGMPDLSKLPKGFNPFGGGKPKFPF